MAAESFMSVPPLPYELIEKIVKFAERQELPALSCASHTFQNITEPVLYREISHLTCRRTIHALRSIVRYPDAVRHRHVRLFSVWMTPSSNAQLLRSFFHLLAKALNSMTRLESLSIVNLPPSEAWVLSDCVAQPRVFVTTIPPGAVLSSWLQKQRRMEVLVLANKYIAHWHEQIKLPPSAMPKLRIVCAKGNVLQSLVPGRPVVHTGLDFTLDNKDDGNGYEEMTTALSLSTAPLRTFGIHFRPAPRDHIIVPELPMFASTKARGLEMVTFLDMHIPTFSFFDAFPQMSTTLENFTSLISVQLTGRHLNSMYSSSDLQSFADVWHAHCPTLTRATFRDSGEHLRDDPLNGVYEYVWQNSEERMSRILDNTTAVPVAVEDVHGEYEYYAGVLNEALKG